MTSEQGAATARTGISATARTRYEGKSYDRTEWDDLVKRHELYLMVLIFTLVLVLVLTACLSVFGHCTRGFITSEGDLEYRGGIWQLCTKSKTTKIEKCVAVDNDLVENPTQPLKKWNDNIDAYKAARAFLIIAHVYNFALLVAGFVIICKKLYSTQLFCGITVAGLFLLIWFIIAAAVMTNIFDDNGPKSKNNSDWSVHVLWLCMIISILCVALPIMMFCLTRKIDDMKKEDARQHYEPIKENVSVKVEHYE